MDEQEEADHSHPAIVSGRREDNGRQQKLKEYLRRVPCGF